MKNNKLIISLLVGGVILVFIVGFALSGSLNNSNSSSSNTSQVVLEDKNITSQTVIDPSVSSGTASSQSSTGYKDGTYTADAPYFAPSGSEDMSVSITLAGGNVTAVTVTGSSSNRTSNEYMQTFKNNISGLIVGKPIDGAYVDGHVSGASLNAQAFHTAVDSIIQQAKI